MPHQATETAFERLCRLIEDRTGAYPRGNGRQVSALCPAHDDRTPSLSITDGNDRVLIKCQAGCDTDDIITELGLTRADLFNEPRQKGQRPTVIAEYTYTDEHGTVLFVAERLMPKGFRQKRPDGKGGWDYKLGNTRRVIYRLPEVIEAVKNGRTIYITEGEKVVHAVEATGNVATCNPMGAGKWRDEYALTFKGADVIVIADADEPGRRHAATVAASIRSAGGRARIVEPAEGCKDAHDHLSAGHTLEELREPRPELTVIDGGHAEADNPPGITFVNWNDLFNKPRTPTEWLARPLLASGRVTLLYSPGKTGKSLIAMEIAAGLATGTPVFGGQTRDAMNVLYIDQEMTEEDWLERLTDMGYKPGDAQFLTDHLFLAQLQAWPPMDTFAGGAMVAATAEQTKARAVIIDTASKVIAGEENSNDTQQAFYRNTVVPLKRTGVAVLVLDHTGKDIERGARGGSAKTDNVDLAFELLIRGKDTLSLKNTHARFRDAALEDKVTYLKRITDPELRHHVENVDQHNEDVIEICLAAIRRLAPLRGTSARQVLTDLKNDGKGWQKATCDEAYRRYRHERGWER